MPTAMTPDLIFGLLALSFFKLLSGAGLGSVLVAAVSETLGQTRKKAFLDKFALQASALGFKALTAGLAGSVCALGFLALKRPWSVQPLLESRALLVLFAGWFLFIGLLAVYSLTWRSMKSSKTAHQGLGLFLAALALGLTGLALTSANKTLPLFSLIRLEQAPETAAMATAPSAAMTVALSPDLLAPLALTGLAWTICVAGGLGLLYLLHRREKDDFGRDYYFFALRTGARWALGGLIPALACGAWLILALSEANRARIFETLPLPLAALAGLSLVCAGSWTAVAVSRTPLTLKWLLGLAGLALWLMQGLFLLVALALA